MKGTRVILALAAFVALQAFADDPAASPATAAASTAPRKTDGKPPGGTATKTPAPAQAPGTANMVVTRDPETGELRPATAAEREKLLGRRPLAAPEHKVVTLPDGSVMVELGEADMSYAVATKNADGTLKKACVHGDPKAAKAAAPAAAPTTPAPKTADR